MSAGDTPALHLTVAANLDKLSADMNTAKQIVGSTAEAIKNTGTQASQAAAPAVQQLASATRDFGSQAQQSATFTQLLHTSLQKFDGVLSSVGINIGAETRALAELGTASTQTVASMGALSAGGLVVGAAFAGWGIGRVIADVFGLDGAIEHLTGASQALKNEIAAAQIETIGRAIDAGAAKTISYADAVDFLTKKQKAYNDGLKAITEAGEGWQKTLDTIDGSVVEAIKLYLDAGVAQKDLAGAYGLTEAQVRAVAKARQLDLETIKLWGDIHKTTFELAQQHEKEWHDQSLRLLEERNRAVVAGVAANERAEQELIDFYAQKTLSSTDYQIMKIQEAARAQVAAFQGTIEQRELFNQRVMELANAQAEALKAKEREIVANAQQAALDAANALAAVIPDIGHGPDVPNGEGPAPIVVPPIVLPPVIHQNGIVTNQNTNLTARAGGGPVSAGAPYLVGESGPEIIVPRQSGTVIPNSAIGGGGGTQVIQLVVDGRVLASVVNDVLTRQMRQGRQFPAA